MSTALILLIAASAMSPPQPINPQYWFSPYDYPFQAGYRGEQGDTGYRLTVAKGGRVIHCEITQSSGSPMLDTKFCSKTMGRNLFRGALDRDGQRILGVYRSRMRWIVPEKPAPDRFIPADILLWVQKLPDGFPNPLPVQLNLLVDEAGNIEACEPAFAKMPIALAKTACDQTLAKLKPAPARDSGNMPGRSIQNANIVFAIEGAPRTPAQ